MSPLKIIFPDSLLRLARSLDEVLSGTTAPTTPIDEPLVMLAVRRHQVGPLLYAAALNGRHTISPALLHLLERSYQASAARRTAALMRLNQISQQFRMRDIAWMALKGAPQAGRLYADPAWRDSADIDILVPPQQFSAALDVLIDMGFIASYPPIPSSHALRKPILAAIRDVTLIARDDRSCAVELHRRLFIASDRRAGLLRLEPVPGSLPAPAPGPGLASYVVAHGALSLWVRLKWLVDLVPLFQKLNAAQKLAALNRARGSGTENSFAASLLLLRALFPSAALGPLISWLETKQSEPAVKRRLSRYVEMISLENDKNRSPFDNAVVALESNWMLFESSSTRAHILASAPLSSVARRIAGSLCKADRALTRPTAST